MAKSFGEFTTAQMQDICFEVNTEKADGCHWNCRICFMKQIKCDQRSKSNLMSHLRNRHADDGTALKFVTSYMKASKRNDGLVQPINGFYIWMKSMYLKETLMMIMMLMFL